MKHLAIVKISFIKRKKERTKKVTKYLIENEHI